MTLNDLGLKMWTEEEMYPLPTNPLNDLDDMSPRTDEPINELEYVYAKEYICPLCDQKVSAPVAKYVKLRPQGRDLDARTRYKFFEPLKYDVICCESCGYAALTNFYKPMPKPHKVMVGQALEGFTSKEDQKVLVVDFEEAILRFERAIYCALARQAKHGEKAQICLRLAWIIRSYREFLDLPAEEKEQKLKELAALEGKYLSYALDALIMAKQTEPSVPGMPDVTVDFEIGVLSMKFGRYDISQRSLQDVIQSQMATSQQKDKARDLMYMVKDLLKKQTN